MKAKDIRTKSKEEHLEQIKSLKKEIETTMENVLKGKEKNIKKVRQLRKDISRVLTVMKEKENA